MNPSVWITLSILFVVTIVRVVRERKRAQALQEVAHALGFSYQRHAALWDIDGFALDFHVFQGGKTRHVHHMLSGQRDNIAIRIFDYLYRRGRQWLPNTQTIILLQSSQLNLPAFEVRPAGFQHKIGRALGLKDIDFDTHPVFSERYLLQGRDEKAIRSLFTDEVLSCFASESDVCVVGWDNTLLVYREEQLVPPHKMAAFCEEGLSMVRLFTTPEPQSATASRVAKNKFVTFHCPQCGTTIYQRVAQCMFCDTPLTDEAIDSAVQAYTGGSLCLTCRLERAIDAAVQAYRALKGFR